jgi:hypothetical protein
MLSHVKVRKPLLAYLLNIYIRRDAEEVEEEVNNEEEEEENKTKTNKNARPDCAFPLASSRFTL